MQLLVSLCTEESHTQGDRVSAALSLVVHRGKSQTGRQVSAALSLIVHRGKPHTGRQGECSFKSHCAQRKATHRETW